MKLLLIISFVLSFSANSKNYQLEYQSKLNQYLISDSDINSQLVGLLFSEFFDIAEAKPILTKAINENSSKYTIYLADDICHKYKELINWCHQQDIHKLHITIDSDNIYAYLFQLNDTMSDADISKVLDNAALSSKYSNDFYFDYIPQLQNKINTFNQSNKKLYAKYIKIRNKNYKVLFEELATKNLIKFGLLNIDKINEQSNSLQFVMVIKMSNFFSTVNIKKSCLNPSNHTSCLKLMDILIKDKTVKKYMFGKSLLLDILINQKAERSTIMKHLKSDKLEKYMCYMGASSVEILYTHDMDILNNYLITAKKKDEFEAAKQTSYSVFNLLEQQGIKPDFNPKNCD